MSNNEFRIHEFCNPIVGINVPSGAYKSVRISQVDVPYIILDNVIITGELLLSNVTAKKIIIRNPHHIAAHVSMFNVKAKFIVGPSLSKRILKLMSKTVWCINFFKIKQNFQKLFVKKKGV